MSQLTAGAGVHDERALNDAIAGLLRAAASKLEDLFSEEDAIEIRYLMNRARRTGVASTQLEFKSEQRILHLALTVAALDERLASDPVAEFTEALRQVSRIARFRLDATVALA